MPTLNWIGKEKIINHDKDVPFRLLKKVKKYSLGKSENLIVEGDNLEALKALMPHYYNSVKCIYIDPPYNTGTEKWIYNDNVNSPKIRKWIGKVVGKEGEDLTRHDKWLCMMYPRLKLLKELLDEDGVIFISIDDNELNNLKIIMDDIFDNNIIACLPTIMNLKGNQDQLGFAGTHEYTLAYCKNKSKYSIKDFAIENEEIVEWEEDEYGYFKKGANLKGTGTNAPREKRPNLFYPIFINKEGDLYVTDNNKPKRKNDKIILPITEGKEMSWRWEKKNINKNMHDVIIQKNGDQITLYKKQRPAVGDLPSKKPKSLFYKPEYSSGNGTQLMKQIFGKKVFDNPKPLRLIRDLVYLTCDEDDIVLDTFAGTATTAHAVLDLNKEDGKNRKFILVELESNIAQEITSVRTKKVIEGYSYKTNKGKTVKVEGLGGGFEYVHLGNRLFDENGKIEKKVNFNDLASYIYFMETKMNLENIKPKDNYIGENKDTKYYLLFRKVGGNILNRTFANKLKKIKGSKIVYADKCLVDEDELDKHEITFKQIPYQIKVY